MTSLQSVQPSLPNTSIVVSKDITLKMCLKINHQRVHEIVTSPGHNGQDIYPGEDNTADVSEKTPNVLLGT